MAGWMVGGYLHLDLNQNKMLILDSRGQCYNKTIILVPECGNKNKEEKEHKNKKERFLCKEDRKTTEDIMIYQILKHYVIKVFFSFHQTSGTNLWV